MVTYKEYQGKPLIQLGRDELDRYAFAFGIKKAKLILEHLDEIRAFVEKYGEEKINV